LRGQRHAPAAFYPRETTDVQEAGWAPGPVWTAENLALQGFAYRYFECCNIYIFFRQPTYVRILTMDS